MQNDSDESVVVNELGDVLKEHDIMRLFDELCFREKWSRVFKGLQQDKRSGEHKWAKLQLLRLLAPIMAVCVPLLVLLLIAFLAQLPPLPHPEVITIPLDEPPRDEKLDVIQPVEPDRVENHDPFEQITLITNASPMDDSHSQQPEAVQPQTIQAMPVQDITSPVSFPDIGGPTGVGVSRGEIVKRRPPHTAASVLRALRWLAVQQHADGSWGNTKPAITSLALLTYLAHGETAESKEFGAVVERGLRFLVNAQEPDGRFRGRDAHDYTHPIAAYALSEAFHMSPSPHLRKAAAKAIARVVDGQNPSGGFDYNLRPSNRNDISYAGWCIQALKSASMAGLERDVPGIKAAMARAVAGVKANFRGEGRLGGFGYTEPSATHGLAGVGVLALQFLGEGDSREARMGLAGLHRWPFDWENPRGRSPVYWWYYNTQAFYQEGGQMWTEWDKQFSHTLVRVQNVISAPESGYVDHVGRQHDIGYWDSPASTELTGGNGRVMDTILCTLMLEVYYRHLPTFAKFSQEEIRRELGDEADLSIRFVQIR
jgi:hypothetical protein